MILLFRIISDEDPGFLRDLVIEDSDTFLDFHRVLQKDLDFDPTQLASFFITNESWEKQKEITLIDMMQDPRVETLTMGEVTLGEFITEVNQRMIYVFDFFSERAFFMELIERSDQISMKETPFIAHARGEAPEQMAMDLLMDDSEGDSMDPESLDDSEDLWLDDMDPDLFGDGNPEDD
jgi:hypothetical protein